MGEPVEDEIRGRLIDAAADVFAESGFDGARVARIAEKAGLTTGAIYNRFGGKTELLLEALDHHADPQFDLLLEADLVTADVLAAAGASLVDGKPSLGNVLMYELCLSARREPQLAERLRPVLANTRTRLGELVADDQANGRIAEGLDVQSIVTFCQAVDLGMGLLSHIGAEMPDQLGWETLIDRLIHALDQPIDSPENQE